MVQLEIVNLFVAVQTLLFVVTDTVYVDVAVGLTTHDATEPLQPELHA